MTRQRLATVLRLKVSVSRGGFWVAVIEHIADQVQRSSDERVDFIYASRPAARGLLEHATAVQTAFGEVRVVSAEGLIGLKLQALVNNPRRTQNLEDITALIAANRQALKMDQVREYFRLFDREELLQEILR